MKIKIDKKQNINNGVLYEWVEVTNLNNGEKKESRVINEYYGDDIINSIKMKKVNVENGRGISYIAGSAYANSEVVETEIYEYSDDEDTRELEIKKQGWASTIETALYCVCF